MKKFAMLAVLAVCAVSFGCGQEEAVKEGIDKGADAAKAEANKVVGDKADDAIDTGAEKAKDAVDAAK